MHGECELPFENLSDEEVHFSIAFYDPYHYYEDDFPVATLMNNDAPYGIRVKDKEKRDVKIKTNIDVSGMKSHIEGGGANELHIVMKSGGKSRDL